MRSGRTTIGRPAPAGRAVAPLMPRVAAARTRSSLDDRLARSIRAPRGNDHAPNYDPELSPRLRISESSLRREWVRRPWYRWRMSRLCRFHHLLLKSQLNPAHINPDIRGAHFPNRKAVLIPCEQCGLLSRTCGKRHLGQEVRIIDLIDALAECGNGAVSVCRYRPLFRALRLSDRRHQHER